MLIRTLTLVGGLAGAGTLAQFPEFSQQYTQRLGGAVEALGEVVADFDASAQAEGLTRAQALAEMTGGDFVERRQADMQRTFERHAYLQSAQQALQDAGPFMRAYHVGKLTDTELMGQTADIFKPAVPVTFEGLVFAALGFLAGLGAVSLILRVMTAPFRRRRLNRA